MQVLTTLFIFGIYRHYKKNHKLITVLSLFFVNLLGQHKQGISGGLYYSDNEVVTICKDGLVRFFKVPYW